MKTKIFTLISFLSLFVYWCFVSLVPSFSSHHEDTYALVSIVFSLLIGIFLFIVVIKDSRLPRGLSLLTIAALSDVFFSILGTSANLVLLLVLLVIQFFVVFSLISLLDPEQVVSDSLGYSTLLVTLICSLSIAFSGVVLRQFDVTRFLLIYTPLYRTSIIIISLQYLLKDGLQNKSVWKAFLSLGYMCLLLGDLVYYRGMLAGENLAQNSHTFLYTSGFFLISMAILRVLEKPLSVFDIRGSGITYFRNITQKVPVSLN